MIHEKFGSPKGLYDKKSRSDFYAKADGYIFVSESTRKDFSDFYPEFFRKKPSQVIWHGSNYVTEHEISKKNPKQFLFVGSRRGYKNFITAAKAFCEIAKINPKVRLVIVGAPPLPEELELLKEIYLSSLALLYTSNYEGFGMPLVEAMSQGCIPIAGRHSSIPEVLGSAGLFVNTNSVSEVTSAIYKCATDIKFVENLQQRGYSRINEFDWNSTALQTIDFYKSL